VSFGSNWLLEDLGSGGKQPKMRDGWYVNSAGQKVSQPMQDADGIQKGLQVVLTERGLWRPGLRLECRSCPDASSDCCARRIMSSQADFVEQKSQLVLEVEAAGHIADFYPKYHCETNFIERVWGEAKRWARKDCQFDFTHLKENVVKIIRNIPLDHIRRYYRRAMRYVDAYRRELSGPLAEWAVQKYRRHRAIQGTLEGLVEYAKEGKQMT